jgi:hypothetical protein
MMIVLVHVIIALSSMAYTTYLFISPAKVKFYISYALIGLTLASGTYLVLSTHSRLLPACEAGLFYLVIVTAGVTAAHRKLSRSEEI